ncbi:MAG: HPr family phosphocarrier protein [Planctomycetota bacterium]
MPDFLRSEKVTINNPQGLHMRPAYLFAETASKFECKIELVKDDIRIDGKSVLSILTLGATQGTEVHVEANGSDAKNAISTLQDLLTSGFPATADPQKSNPS